MRYLKLSQLLILLIFFLGGCDPNTRPVQKNLHSLWKVKGTKNTVYFLGSIHVGRPDMYPLPDIVSRAFTKSDYLVVELDISKVNNVEMMSHMMYPLGDNLKKHIDEQTYLDLIALTESHHVPQFTIKRLYPWAVSSTLDMLLLMDQGYRPDLGIDMHFLTLNKSKKPVLELETAQQQMKVFQDISEEEQIQMLRTSIYSNQNNIRIMDTLVEAWKRGDSASVSQYYIGEALSNQAQLYENLLFQRNKTMTDKILTYLDDNEDYFVIVGLAHFCGPGSILDLLSQAGYTVEQL